MTAQAILTVVDFDSYTCTIEFNDGNSILSFNDKMDVNQAEKFIKLAATSELDFSLKEYQDEYDEIETFLTSIANEQIESKRWNALTEEQRILEIFWRFKTASWDEITSYQDDIQDSMCLHYNSTEQAGLDLATIFKCESAGYTEDRYGDFDENQIHFRNYRKQHNIVIDIDEEKVTINGYGIPQEILNEIIDHLDSKDKRYLYLIERLSEYLSEN
jgi:hypothetical protein